MRNLEDKNLKNKARIYELVEENRLLAAENVISKKDVVKWRNRSAMLEMDLNRTAEEAAHLKAALARCEKKLAARRRPRVGGVARRGK